jgi:hypothetical protein
MAARRGVGDWFVKVEVIGHDAVAESQGCEIRGSIGSTRGACSSRSATVSSVDYEAA